MKSLTLCEPFATLVCLPDDDHRAKRVENRPMLFNHRGPLLIHAGISRKWLARNTYGITEDEMTFGAILGVCNVIDGFRLHEEWKVRLLFAQENRIPAAAIQAHPWLADHQHVEGPCCLVLADVKRFETPIPYKGKQGLFEIPVEGELERQLKTVGFEHKASK